MLLFPNPPVIVGVIALHLVGRSRGSPQKTAGKSMDRAYHLNFTIPLSTSNLVQEMCLSLAHGENCNQMCSDCQAYTNHISLLNKVVASGKKGGICGSGVNLSFSQDLNTIDNRSEAEDG